MMTWIGSAWNAAISLAAISLAAAMGLIVAMGLIAAMGLITVVTAVACSGLDTARC